MAKKEKTDYLIQSVSHALEILEQFQEEVDELGITELSKRLNISKINVIKLLSTMETRGFIDHNKLTENYRLGLKTLELGQTYIHQMDLKRQSRPFLEELVRKCNETSYIAILKDFSITYIDCVETDLSVRVIPRVGSWLPAYCTAAGKIQIAHMREKDLEMYLERNELKPFTANTITNREALKKQLTKIAAQGYAIDNEELDVGVKCVSAPIRDYTRRIIGAVSISGPSMRFDADRMEKELVPLVLKSTADISTRLGYQK